VGQRAWPFGLSLNVVAGHEWGVKTHRASAREFVIRRDVNTRKAFCSKVLRCIVWVLGEYIETSDVLGLTSCHPFK
jgi:hypothetical protein